MPGLDRLDEVVEDGLFVAIGDEVVLLGSQGSERVTAEELALWAGTIPYEILTNVSRRVPRFYLDRT